MLQIIIIMIAAFGIGVPVACKLELTPLLTGLFVGGLCALFGLIFPG